MKGTRKQTIDSTSMNNLNLTFVDHVFRKRIPKFINVNTLSTINLERLIHTMRDAYAKSSVPDKLQVRSYQGDIINAAISGHHYPINTQTIKPYGYTHKPFGNKVLDFNPDTAEFIVYNKQEWNENNYYKSVTQSGNSLPSLMQYVPMGMEIEVIYRNDSSRWSQCSDCREHDYDNDTNLESFCDDAYCYWTEDDHSHEAANPKVKAYTLLAQLNIAFGAVTKKSEPVWIVKHDSSVDLEYVSMPMTLRAWRAGLELTEFLFRSFSIASGWSKAFYGPCGGHIHLDKDVFNNTYQYYAFLSMHYDNPKFIAAIAQRPIDRGSQWCYLQKPNEFAKYAKHKLRSPNRGAVNVSTSTIELRYFRSNLKVDRLLKNLEFAQSMYHYTSQLTYQDIARDKAHTLKYYLLWIKAYRNTYSHLFEYLVQRNWIKYTDPKKQKPWDWQYGDDNVISVDNDNDNVIENNNGGSW